MAAFELTELGALKTRAGVLASSRLRFATIPVENDDAQGRFTGFAVANPNNETIGIRLVTLRADGTIADDIVSQRLRLGPQSQTAIFLHEILPLTVRFRGSMVLAGQEGKSFAVVALSLTRGILTTIPVIPEKHPNVAN